MPNFGSIFYFVLSACVCVWVPPPHEGGAALRAVGDQLAKALIYLFGKFQNDSMPYLG